MKMIRGSNCFVKIKRKNLTHEKGRKYACVSYPFATRISLKNGGSNTDGFTLGTAYSRKAPGKGNYQDWGTHYSFLIWSLQYPVRQMKKEEDHYLRRSKLQVEVFGFSCSQVETEKQILYVQETQYWILLLQSSCKFKGIKKCEAKIEIVTFNEIVYRRVQ